MKIYNNKIFKNTINFFRAQENFSSLEKERLFGKNASVENAMDLLDSDGNGKVHVLLIHNLISIVLVLICVIKWFQNLPFLIV